MTATVQDFEIHSGDDKTLVITVTDSGAAVDLTNAESVIWKATRNGTTFAIVKSLDVDALFVDPDAGGIAITDGPGGVIEITIDAADTEDLSGAYYHELQVQNATGKRATVMTGSVNIINDSVTE